MLSNSELDAALDAWQKDRIQLQESLEEISDRLGVIANALLMLADVHGSKTPGPF